MSKSLAWWAWNQDSVRIYVCTDHAAHYPVGVASVIVSCDEAEARALLDAQLAAHSLAGGAREPYTLREVKRHTAEVLCDGNY